MNWYWILGWLPSIFAVVGNAFVFCLICSRRKLRRAVPNLFIMSQALADLGVGLSFFPAHFICGFLFSSCVRRIAEDIAVFMIYSSTASICAMTLDRYLAIVKPFTYATVMTRRRVLYLIASSWVVPLISFFVPSFCTSLGGCSINRKVTIITWTTMFEFIPCVVLILATVKIVSSVKKYYHEFANIQFQLRYNEPSRKSVRFPKLSTARVIVTVVICFLVCYSLEFYSSICFFTKLCKFTDDIFKAVAFLIVTNSAINPIAYALLKRDIQREMRTLFFKGKQSTATSAV